MNVSTKEVWDDVAGTAFGDADQDNCVNDAFEHGAVTVQLHSSESTEMFEAEFDDSASTVINFNKFEICVNDGAHDVLDPIYFENPFPSIINRSTLKKNLNMFYSHTNRTLN